MSLLSSLRSSARSVIGGSLLTLLSSMAPAPAIAQQTPQSASSVVATAAAPVVVQGAVAAAHASGAYGSEWRTDMWVHNADSVPATVDLYFSPSGAALSDALTLSRVVPAGQTLALRDVVGQFGVSGGGLLGYSVAGASLDRVLFESNTFNFVNATTAYGSQMSPQRWDKVPPARLSVTGDMRLHLPVVLDGAQYRNNLILLSDKDATIARVEIVARTGVPVAEEYVTFTPNSHTQLNNIVARYALDNQMPGLTARITPQNGKVIAAMSVIDNVSNDSTIFLAQHVNNNADVDNTAFGTNEHNMWLPGVAYADGANASKWRSDVQVINPLATPSLMSFFFHPMGADNSGQLIVNSILNGGNTSQFLRNILGDAPFYLQNGSAGALRVATLQSLPQAAFLRTYNDTVNSEGVRMTYGQGIPPRNDSTMITDLVEGRIVGIDVNSDYRANLHLQNTHRGTNNVTLLPTTVDVELLLADGTSAGVKTYQILPGEYHQINNFAHEFLGPNGTVNGGTLRITTRGVKTDGTLGSEYGGLDARVSVINNTTNDGRLITAALVPPKVDYAQQYVDKYLDTSVIWLDNSEARYVIGARLDEFATELTHTPGGVSFADARTYLSQLIDNICSPTNIEFWSQVDPFVWAPNATPQGKIETFGTAGNCQQMYIDDTPLPSDSMQRVRTNIIRPGLIEYVRAHPEKYGNYQTPPTWTVQNAN